MKRISILSLACCLVCFWGALALAVTPEAQQKVVTSASKNVVEIGLSYHGDQIFFFGVNPVPGSDVVIKLTAEKEEAVKLSVKGKVGPFWMTVKQYEVTGSPFIYKLHASKPLDQIISKETAQELELGYRRGAAQDEDAPDPGRGGPRGRGRSSGRGCSRSRRGPTSITSWKTPTPGDLRGQALQALFPLSARGHGRTLSGGILCFQGGIGGYGKDVIEIKKVGLEHWLTQTSKNQPVFYGIMAVLVAVGAGLLVGVIFGKGGHH